MAYSSINNNYDRQLEHMKYISSAEYKTDRFLYLSTTRSFSYWYGCDGRNNWCKANRYDCSGIMTQLLREVWTYSWKKLHTSTFHNIWDVLSRGVRARRWDFAILLPDPNYQGRQHLVFVIEDLWNKVKILDRVVYPWKPATTRVISKSVIKYFVRINWMKENRLPKNFSIIK